MKTSALVSTFQDLIGLSRWLMIFCVIAYLFSGITVVGPDETAMILRFGRLLGENRADRLHGPGWLPALPRPMDRVIKIPSRQIREILIRDLNGPLRSNSFVGASLDPVRDGYCLTGDHNILQAAILVKYQISDPVSSLFGFAGDSLKGLETIIRDTVVSQMSRISGTLEIDSLLSSRKEEVATAVRQRAQERLDAIDSGAQILFVEFKEMGPPRQVSKAFEEVNTAAISMKSAINRARSRSERELPQARSDGRKLVNQAQAYREQKVSEATGRAQAFTEMVQAHEQRGDILVREMVNSARSRIMNRLGRVVVIPSTQEGAAGITSVIDGGMASSPKKVENLMRLYQDQEDTEE